MCYDVTVEVKETKSNGNPWDSIRGEAPDVRVCFSDAWGIRCKGKGDGLQKAGAFCTNSHRCELGVIRFIERVTMVQIKDVDDVSRDDPVATGKCTPQEEELCDLGNARLHFRPSPCD